MPEADHQFKRCSEILLLASRLPQEAQCALYLGHLGEVHETEPLSPDRQDKSDGVHQFTWRVGEDGIPTDVQEQRLDAGADTVPSDPDV